MYGEGRGREKRDRERERERERERNTVYSKLFANLQNVDENTEYPFRVVADETCLLFGIIIGTVMVSVTDSLL